MKKLLIVLGGLIGLIIVALLLVPVLYPVENLKPKIEQAIAQKTRGQVKLGKLSLRAFPKIRLTVDDVHAWAPAPYDKEELASVKAMHVEMGLLSLLFAPRVKVELEGANILLVQDGEKSNLKAFLPEVTPEQAANDAQAKAQGGSPAVDESLKALPSFVEAKVRSARLSFALQDSHVAVRDLTAPKTNRTEASDIDLILEDIGIGSPVKTKFSADVNYVAESIQAQGKMSGDGSVTFTPEGQNNKINLDLGTDLSGLNIAMKPLFKKDAGVAMKAAVKGVLNQGPVMNTNLDNIEFQLGDFKMAGTLKGDNLQDPTLATVNLHLNATDAEISGFGGLVPMIREYKLGGKVSLAVKADGLILTPKVDISVGLKDVKGATPQLQKPITNLNGTIRVVGTAKNPAVTIDPFSMKIGSSDLSVKLQSTGIENIDANIRLSSKSFNADELLGLQPVKVGEALKGGEPGQVPAPAPGEKSQPLDESLDAMAPTLEAQLKNPMLDKVKATVVCDFKYIRALGAEYTGAEFNMRFANRNLTIDKSSIGGYGGRVGLDGTFGLQNPKAPTYNINANLTNVEIGKMTAAHAPKWNGQLTGGLTGQMKITGRGVRKAQLNEALTGSLNGDVKNGRTSLPIVKMVNDIIKNLPSIAGKKAAIPNENKEFKGEFKTLKLSTLIKGRNIEIKELDVYYNTGDLKVGDIRFTAKGNVNFDRIIDITGVAYLDPDKVPVPALKGASGKIELPVKAKGSMDDPKPDYAYTIKLVGPKLAKGVLESEAGKAAIGKAADKLQEKAPENLKKGIDDLRKKFKF